jgi:hypothetical protein
VKVQKGSLLHEWWCHIFQAEPAQLAKLFQHILVHEDRL